MTRKSSNTSSFLQNKMEQYVYTPAAKKIWKVHYSLRWNLSFDYSICPLVTREITFKKKLREHLHILLQLGQLG